MMQFKFPKMKLDQEPTMRERIFFGVVLLGIFFLFANFFWTPRMQGIKAAKSDLMGVTQQIDALQKLIDAIESQLTKKTEAPKDEPKMDEQVRKILERRVSDPADEINSTVDLLGSRQMVGRLKVKNITIGDRVERKTYSVVPLSVELEGSYTGIQGYLHAIENLERPMAVGSFDLASDREMMGLIVSKIEVELYLPKR